MTENYKNKNYFVTKHSTIKEAMEAMNDNQRGAVIVLDDEKHVLGVVSDGEIRRSLVAGKEILSSVDKIMNLNPKVIIGTENAETQAEEIFKEKFEIHLIPVVNKENKLLDIIIRDPEIRK